MHPTYILQQVRIKLHANLTEDIIREMSQRRISKEKELNVVSLFEERTQCCIFSSVYI